MARRPLVPTILGALLLASTGISRAASGDFLWSFEDSGPFTSCADLAVGDGLAFAYAGTSTVVSGVFTPPRLYALDLATGDLAWQVEDGPSERNVEVVFTDGKVVTTSTREASSRTIGTVFTRARDASSGTLIWQHKLGPGRFRYLARALAADSRTTAVAGARRTTLEPLNVFDFAVSAYDTVTGEPLWSDAFDIDGDWDRAESVAVARGVVVVGGRVTDSLLDLFHVRAYAARTGELLWEDSARRGEALAILIRDGYVFAAGPAGPAFEDHSHLRAYDLESGELIWARRIRFQVELRSLAISGPRIVAGGLDVQGASGAKSFVGAYARANGQPLWLSRDPGAAAEVAARRNRVFAAALGPVTRSWRGGSGRPRWQAEIPPPKLFPTCAVEHAGDRLVVSSRKDPGGFLFLNAYEP